jgi:hypothetical protein
VKRFGTRSDARRGNTGRGGGNGRGGGGGGNNNGNHGQGGSGVSVGLLDGLSPTSAFSFSRDLLTAFVGSSRYTTGTGISTWEDQSGNNRDFSQGTGASQPTLTTAGSKSRACANFDGTNDSLAASGISNFFANSAGYLIVSFLPDVVNTNFGTSSDDMVWGDFGDYTGLFLRNNSSVYSAQAYNYDGTVDLATASITIGAANVVEWRHESGNLYIRVNAGSWSAGTTSGNTGAMTGVLRLGQKSAGTELFEGKIFEFATWSTVPTNGQMNQIASGFVSWIGA